MNYFSSERLSENLIRIVDVSKTACYLVIGESRACLIDTGIGFGNLRDYVDELTSLPYDVVLTHGHADHVGNASQFADKRIYLHPADRALMKIHTECAMRVEILQQSGYKCDSPLEHMAQPLNSEATLALTDGQTFDLGGITLRAIHTPGHTQGMTMFLMPEIRTILFGDGCGVCVLLVGDCASTVAEYLETLKKLKVYESEYDCIIRQHGSYESPKELLDNVIECCELVLEGKDDHQTMPYFLEPDTETYLAKAYGEHGRLDGKQGDLVYTPSKIR